MNIFVLDEDIVTSAQHACDQHACKMPTETAQLICFAHHSLGQLPPDLIPYKANKAHLKHPCTLWALESLDNYLWLCEFGLAQSAEYTFRYGKIIKSEEVIRWGIENIPDLPDVGLTRHRLAMPEHYRRDSVVDSYREFYNQDKSRFARWRKARPAPDWYEPINHDLQEKDTISA
jgi:hypothetical protein